MTESWAGPGNKALQGTNIETSHASVFRIWQLCKTDFKNNQVLSKLKMALSWTHISMLSSWLIDCVHTPSPSHSGEEQPPSDQGSNAIGMLSFLPVGAP